MNGLLPWLLSPGPTGTTPRLADAAHGDLLVPWLLIHADPPVLRSSSLYLDHLELKTVPEALWRLPHLRALSLDHSDLQELPEPPVVPALEHLSLGSNELVAVPPWLRRLNRLTFLNLSDNPLPPAAWPAARAVRRVMPSLKTLLELHHRWLGYRHCYGRASRGGGRRVHQTIEYVVGLELLWPCCPPPCWSSSCRQ